MQKFVYAEKCEKNIFDKYFLEKSDRESQIRISKQCETQIQWCFNCQLDFHYQENTYELEGILEEFKKTGKVGLTKNVHGRNEQMDWPIVLDDLSGLADKSNAFTSFLTVSQKVKCNCGYIFHIIYPNKSICELILPQTKIFNIFSSSVQQSNARLQRY